MSNLVFGHVTLVSLEILVPIPVSAFAEFIDASTGILKGHDLVNGDCQLFLSFQNAAARHKKSCQWVTLLGWDGGVAIVKRFGNLDHKDTRLAWGTTS